VREALGDLLLGVHRSSFVGFHSGTFTYHAAGVKSEQ
jgi:hypothetical protein